MQTDNVNQILLSICIPTFNRYFELKQLLDSIICEKIDSNYIEIIISDNNSNDNTFQLLNDYSNDYNYIRFSQNQSNIGMIPNWEKAISLARGKYVWLLGSDDLVINGAVKKIINIINNYSFDLILCNCIYVNNLNENQNKSDDIVKYSNVISCYNENKEVEFTKDLIETRIDIFTPIYCSIMLTEHWKLVFTEYDFDSPFFSSVFNAVPQAVYVAKYLLNKPAYYFGEPLVISSLSSSWREYFPFYLSKILPDLYDIFEKNGALSTIINKNKKELLSQLRVRDVLNLLIGKFHGHKKFSLLNFIFQFKNVIGFKKFMIGLFKESIKLFLRTTINK